MVAAGTSLRSPSTSLEAMDRFPFPTLTSRGLDGSPFAMAPSLDQTAAAESKVLKANFVSP